MDKVQETGVVRPWSPVGAAECSLVRDELERILSHPLFKNSKRFPAFLRHVVEQTLAGQGSLLKERSLGIDLFERPPDYDTNADHIVRSTAAEIRKRIGQYYHEPGNRFAVQIDLPAGSYVAEFCLLADGRQDASEVASTTTPPPPVEPKRHVDSQITAIIVAAILIPLLALAVWRRLDSSDGAVELFWKGILASDAPVTLCISTPTPKGAMAPAPLAAHPFTFLQLHESEAEHVSEADVETLSRIAYFLGTVHKPFQIRRQPISLGDLRQGPIVLIGAFNNDWTVRLTGQWRYRFKSDSGYSMCWIEDSRHPEKHDWSFDFKVAASSTTVDYGLVTRVFDATTGRQLIVAAGIAKYGTVAAGELLTNPDLIADFERAAPKDWRQKNVQIVLRTKVISDNSGPPEIVGTWFW